MRFKRQHFKKGFTLIEIMVALTIFMLVVIMALGALLLVSDSAKQTLSLRTSMDNVNIAMESMTRSLRMGRDFSCKQNVLTITPGTGNSTADCNLAGSGGNGIVFTTAEQSPSAFDTGYISADRVSGIGKTIQKCVGTQACLDIVAPNVNIETLKFYVTGSSTADTIQPSVYIIMKGSVTIKNSTIPFAIQTMASQRSSD